MTVTLIEPVSPAQLNDTAQPNETAQPNDTAHLNDTAPLTNTAACLDVDTALFFSDDLDDIAVAKRTCLSCPLRSDCLDSAVDRGEQYGIWGGHLFVAGRILLAKRRRGRPPKSPRPNDTFPEVEVPDAYRRLVTSSG